MTYWACSVWCITENLPSLQVSCSVNIQTGTLPANERRINVQYCIMSTSRIMTAGYFLFERMPEWGCGLQSINSWCGLSLTHSHWGGSETWGAPVSAPLLWRPKTVKWTWRRVGGKTHRDKSGQKLTSVKDAVSGTSARLFSHNMLWRRAETYTHEHSCLSLLYLNPNTHSRLERRFCLSVQWRGRRWRAMSYFIAAGKNKQLMQTLDIPAGTFLPRAPRCQLRNSWVKPVRKPSRCEVFLKPGTTTHSVWFVRPGWPALHPPLHWLEAYV